MGGSTAVLLQIFDQFAMAFILFLALMHTGTKTVRATLVVKFSTKPVYRPMISHTLLRNG